MVQNFKTSSKLRIYVLADPRLTPAWTDRLFNSHAASSLRYLGAAYPIDAQKLRFQRFPASKATLDIDSLQCLGGWNWGVDCWANRIFAQLTRILDTNASAGPEQQFERFVLLVTGQGLADILGEKGITGISDSKRMAIVSDGSTTTLAHEIGHTYGLGDTYEGGTSSPANPRRSGAPPAGNPVEEGVVRLAPLWNENTAGGVPQPEPGASASVDAKGLAPFPPKRFTGA